MHRILIVDDDPLTLTGTTLLLEKKGYRVDAVLNGQDAVQKLKGFGDQYSLVLLDFRLKDEDGASVARRLLEVNPELYVLIYSGDSGREAVKESWGSGAIGFIEKGCPPDLLLTEVANWCSKYNETRKKICLQSSFNEFSDQIASMKLIGRSKKMAAIAAQVQRYAPMREAVLILGETGTGKEQIAKALYHGQKGSFVPVNCAAYAGKTDLMESELFGHEKGSFTGAVRDTIGVFESANGGTVLLDEVHALDLIAQQKLLRVLQEKKIRRVGGTKEISVAFRLIATSKPDLESLIACGEFLPDLYERLNVLRISVPPLRERPEDIEPLVAFFTANYERESGEKRAFLFRTLRYLEKYSWPRNVRELENTVKRLCINSNTEQITPDQLDAHFFSAAMSPITEIAAQHETLLSQSIEDALAKCQSQRQAAKRLQIPESSLRRLIKKYEIKEKTRQMQTTTFTNSRLPF